MLALSNASIPENTVAGTDIGTLSTTDPDAGEVFTYTLVPAFGDNGNFQILGDKLQTKDPLDFETKSNYSIMVRTTDFTGLSHEEIFTVSVTDVAESLPPVIGAFDTTVTFVENGTAVLLDTNATLTDSDSLDFVGGSMTVSLITNSKTTGRLLIRHVGVGTGQIGVSGNQVTYSGNPIATFAGGLSGSDPLVVSCGAGGTKVAAQALLRNLSFNNLSETPSTLPRTVQVIMTDGDGGVSLPVTKTINITAVNDAPVISNFTGVVSFTEGDTPVLISTGTSVLDVDSTDFALGLLTVRVLVNTQTTDRLSIRNDGIAPGEIGIGGSNVLYGNLVIGSFTGTTTLEMAVEKKASLAAKK